jgi:hypothetical protein
MHWSVTESSTQTRTQGLSGRSIVRWRLAGFPPPGKRKPAAPGPPRRSLRAAGNRHIARMVVRIERRDSGARLG